MIKVIPGAEIITIYSDNGLTKYERGKETSEAVVSTLIDTIDAIYGIRVKGIYQKMKPVAQIVKFGSIGPKKQK